MTITAATHAHWNWHTLMEAVKKPQQFKQVMGITTGLLICAHSKTKGFTCYSNDRTWLHRHGEGMCGATEDNSATKINNQILFGCFINNTQYVHVSNARVEEPIDCCTMMDDLLSATACSIYVQLCRSNGSRNATELCIFSANTIQPDCPSNTLAIQWGQLYYFVT